jgi:hypothetical protein
MEEEIKETAIRLANIVIVNPDLLDVLSDDKFYMFVMGVARYDKSLAMKLEDIRPITNTFNKL